MSNIKDPNAEPDTYAQIDAQGVKRDSQGNVYRPDPSATNPSVTYNPDGTRGIVDQYWDENSPTATADKFATDQANTKSDFYKRQQDAINAVDNMYVSILARANDKNANRLGSANVINALSGQRGSASGAANVDTIIAANNADLEAIQKEKNAKITEIIGTYHKNLDDELKYQNELRQKNTDSWLAYLGSKESENKLNSKAMRADLLKSNIKIEDIAPDQLQKMAEAAGYSVDQFKILYESERKAQEKSFANAEIERLSKLEKEKLEREKLATENQNLKYADEKDLALKGYVYVATPAERDRLKAQGYDITTLNGRTYAKPGELSTYEAKKKIDAKYAKKSGSVTGSGSKEFNTAVKEGIANLQKGEQWGTVWNRIKAKFPNAKDSDIDVALGPEWKEGGAFENWKSKQYKPGGNTQWQEQSPVWQWLASEEAMNMTEEQRKQEVMTNGFNPEDFGLY
ncbi:MAG: hypothetical protein CSYNP_03129 [Syntrophus sp. SKADARSKE-3]|nr:hypothetical protein [Syntrophus sp. SKADARSKE-3]